MSYPPCCSVGWMRSFAETNAFCRKVAGVPDLKLAPIWRGRIMGFAAAVSFICVILQAVPLFSLSTSADTLADVSWTHGEGTVFVNGSRVRGIDLYVGMRAYSVHPDGLDAQSREWDDVDCETTVGAEECDDCLETVAATVSTVPLSFLTSFAQLATDVQRSTPAGDLNCQRFFGIFTGILGLATGLISLATYGAGCRANLPRSITVDNDGSDVEVALSYAYGPSFWCLLVATCCKLIDVICHLLVVTPKGKRGDNADALFALKGEELKQRLAALEKEGA